MEAELALLQDMGYQIDRRNFFGFSLYGNGQTLVNRNGYFQRNQQADGYLAGQYNTANLGLACMCMAVITISFNKRTC